MFVQNFKLLFMSKRSNFVFIGLLIVAWLIFVGLSIEAGGLLVNFIVSLINPGFIRNLYQKIDLTEIYHRSKWAFFSMYIFSLVISISKAYLFYLVVMLMHKINLSKPFSKFASDQILKISYCTFSIGILSYLARQATKFLSGRGYAVDALSQFWVDSNAFILMSAVVYIIAIIIRRGVELQNESELTV